MTVSAPTLAPTAATRRERTGNGRLVEAAKRSPHRAADRGPATRRPSVRVGDGGIHPPAALPIPSGEGGSLAEVRPPQPPPPDPDEPWWTRAACRGEDVDTFFPPPGEGTRDAVAAALSICGSCPVVSECRAACDREEEHRIHSLFGVVGAETPADRARRRRAEGYGGRRSYRAVAR
jgi:hypothetical protein